VNEYKPKLVDFKLLLNGLSNLRFSKDIIWKITIKIFMNIQYVSIFLLDIVFRVWERKFREKRTWRLTF